MMMNLDEGGPNDNEEERAGGLIGSLQGCAENIQQYMLRNGPDSWQDIAVCIVSDGRTKLNPDTRDWLELQGA